MKDAHTFENYFERTITLENIKLTFLANESPMTSIPQQHLPPLYHFHIHGEFFYCAKGKVSIHCKERNVNITEGEIAFIPPNIYHYARFSPDSQIYILGIQLKKLNVKDCFDAYGLLSLLFNAEAPLYFGLNSPISHESISWVYKIPTSDHLIYTLSGAQTLISLADSYKNQNLMADNNNELINEKKNANLFMHLESFIDAHYHKNFTADELAAMLYISTRQLSRIVNERYKAPLHKVIIKKRLESATYFLKNTFYPVEIIISYVGFNTKASFYKAFKKEYGMTPVQFRKLQQNNQESLTDKDGYLL